MARQPISGAGGRVGCISKFGRRPANRQPGNACPDFNGTRGGLSKFRQAAIQPDPGVQEPDLRFMSASRALRSPNITRISESNSRSTGLGAPMRPRCSLSRLTNLLASRINWSSLAMNRLRSLLLQNRTKNRWGEIRKSPQRPQPGDANHLAKTYTNPARRRKFRVARTWKSYRSNRPIDAGKSIDSEHQRYFAHSRDG